MLEGERVVVVSHCILAREDRDTRIEVDMPTLVAGLHNVVVVVVLDNMDLLLEVDNSAGSKVKQQPNRQRVLENWYSVSSRKVVYDSKTYPW